MILSCHVTFAHGTDFLMDDSQQEREGRQGLGNAARCR